MAKREALFNARVLRQHLAQARRDGLSVPAQTKEVIQAWVGQLRTGALTRLSETQAEQAFNSHLFCTALGYEQFASRGAEFSILPKARARGAETPDFVLGRLGIANPSWSAVGEIKGVKIDLDEPQLGRRNQETPVEQAFRYATSARLGVDWVIVTNFKEIRLYRNGYTAAFHRLFLEDLLDDDKCFEFYMLLRPAGLFSMGQDGFSLRLLKASISAGKELTEGFYALYKQVQNEIVNTLAPQKASAGMTTKDLYGKAHKILNRVLFAAFCEDHPAELLPRSTLRSTAALAASKTREGARWQTYLQLFDTLNAGGGMNGLAINAFNGGLFRPDPYLAHVTLPNDLFERSFQAGKGRRRSEPISGVFGFDTYDFAEDLNVQALGAIFEQSLKDLPEGQAGVRGAGSVNISAQEAGGVYYTPAELTGYLTTAAINACVEGLSQTIDRAVANRLSRLKKSPTPRQRQIAELDSLAEALGELKILDPACGSGAFLVQVLAQLQAVYSKVNSTRARLVGAARQQSMLDLDRIILRNNLYGYDILQESVEISRLSIWLRTARAGERLESLDTTVRCQDSLRSREESGYDIIIGNPPWGASLEGWTADEIDAAFASAGNEKDSYAIFVLKARDLLRAGGILAFIVPNSWLTVDGYRDFRKLLLENFSIIEITNVWKVFHDVNHDACILIAKKRQRQIDLGRAGTTARNEVMRIRAIQRGISAPEKLKNLVEGRWWINHLATHGFQFDQAGHRFETIFAPRLAKALDKIQSECASLSEVAKITVGIQVYHNSRVSKEFISQRGFHAAYRKSSSYHPFVTANEVQRFWADVGEQNWLEYSDKLHDKRDLTHYQQPRILVQQIFWQRLSCVLQTPTTPILYLNSVFAIFEPSDIPLEALLGLLNSRFVSATYERRANRLFGDKFPKVSRLDLGEVPIPHLSKAASKDLAKSARSLQTRWQKLRLGFAEGSASLKTISADASLANFGRFWERPKRSFLNDAANRFGTEARADIAAEAFDKAMGAINSQWPHIVEAEAELDEQVRQAYGIGKNQNLDLLRETANPDISWVLAGPRM